MSRASQPSASSPSRRACSTAAGKDAWKLLTSAPDGTLIELVRQGLPSVLLPILAQSLAISTDSLCYMLRIRRRNVAIVYVLSTADSDKVVRAIRALQDAAIALGSMGAAKQWLVRPVRSLGGVTPLSLLDTTAGLELVRQTLGRIEHGICA